MNLCPMILLVWIIFRTEEPTIDWHQAIIRIRETDMQTDRHSHNVKRNYYYCYQFGSNGWQ